MICGYNETAEQRALRHTRNQARRAVHILIDEIGSPGPENIVDIAKRAAKVIRELRAKL